MSSPDSSLSSYSSSWTSKDSQYEQLDSSVLWMLEQLGIKADHGLEPLPTFKSQNDYAQQHFILTKYPHAGNEPKVSSSVSGGEVTRSFLRGRSQWIDEPVISSWREPNSNIIAKFEILDQLYESWKALPNRPFDPFFDPLWLETAATLRDAGLPWHNNNLNMPDEVDSSWPFHFKEFERAAILAKGKRVFDSNASGYVTNWSEGNYYGIRALKQELLRQCPGQQPILLTQHLEDEIGETAANIFGLEWHRVVLDDSKELQNSLNSLTLNGKRPIIFAATLANSSGECDDLGLVNIVSKKFPLFLHIDACRVFDYLTTVDEEFRQTLRLPRLRLYHAQLGVSGCIVDGEVLANTIVAGGSNAYVFPPPVVVLKPRFLGNQTPATVEYVRGTDSTLAGSRDALGPLMMCLQELRFGRSGLRDIYQSCALKRLALMNVLRAMNIAFRAHDITLDLKMVVSNPSTESKLVALGAKNLGKSEYLLTVQPSLQLEDFKSLLSAVGLINEDKIFKLAKEIQVYQFTSTYYLPNSVKGKLWSIVQDFKVAARSSCGYPLNQAPYSALGPAIGCFLTVNIPEDWFRHEEAKILKRRKEMFGLLTPASQESFGASFTTGSTMGNRIGLHAALAQHPGAFVYFSTASHYSVKKTVSDSDDLTSRWRSGRVPHFTEIQADEFGRMIPEKLVRQALLDRAECDFHSDPYQVIIFANLGTTFVGGRDNLVEIGKQLAEIDVVPSYIHVDGALDLGFLAEDVRLGPPGLVCTENGTPIVQGITISHHKVFGIMVSGEVISYCPNVSAMRKWSTLTGAVEPRAIFETWLFEKLYQENDLITIWKYSLDNASLLRKLLGNISVPIRFNEKCIITLLERQPPWLIEEFQLAPEGDWVHFIAMPHISPATVRYFARKVALIDMHCATAYNYIEPSLATTLNRPVKLQRLTCRSSSVHKVLDIARRAFLADPHGQKVGKELEVAQCAQLRTRCIYSAMSFAAVDEHDEPLVVFLAEADRKKVLMPDMLLIKAMFSQEIDMLRDVAIQFFGHLGTLMEVRVEARPQSYEAILYV